MKLLFIYGTLKCGQGRNFYLVNNGASFVGEARTAPRYRLVRQLLSSYPCLIEDRDGVSVRGELWSVPEAAIEIVDGVEGVPNLFRRSPIELEGGSQAEAYLMSRRPFLSRDVGEEWK
jgi:gamma-glutamylcyclotransferase (GGCT)/AIG2-like uncharacterized protein YtfP